MTTKIPETMEDAIDVMLIELAETARMQIKNGDFSSPAALHHGYGTALRNDFGLWDAKSPLTQHFRTRFGLGHADDISDLLIEGMFAKIKGDVFDPEPLVERKKAQWAALKVDAMDQHPVNTPAPERGKPPFDWWAWLGLRRNG
jgi:hypothetical protein